MISNQVAMKALAAHEVSDLRALADRTGGPEAVTLHRLLDAYEDEATASARVKQLEDILEDANDDLRTEFNNHREKLPKDLRGELGALFKQIDEAGIE